MGLKAVRQQVQRAVSFFVTCIFVAESTHEERDTVLFKAHICVDHFSAMTVISSEVHSL